MTCGALLDGPNFGHVATILPDGSPHSVAVWIGVEGDRIVFFTQPSSRKARNLDADPRLAISVVDRENPYRSARLRGRVVETATGEAALAIVDRLSVDLHRRAVPDAQRHRRTSSSREQASLTELPFKERAALRPPPLQALALRRASAARHAAARRRPARPAPRGRRGRPTSGAPVRTIWSA